MVALDVSHKLTERHKREDQEGPVHKQETHGRQARVSNATVGTVSDREHRAHRNYYTALR